jgi:hypothetical protein
MNVSHLTPPTMGAFGSLIGVLLAAFATCYSDGLAIQPQNMYHHHGNEEEPPLVQQKSEDRVTRRDALRRAAAVATTTAAGEQLILYPTRAVASQDVPLIDTTIKVPKVRLGDSNLEVSRTIQGCWQLAGGHGQFLEPDVLANMNAHYDAGITTLDTADIYGISEYVPTWGREKRGGVYRSHPTFILFLCLCSD